MACFLVTGGCSFLPYYMQSIAGQLEILGKRRSIEQVLADPLVAEETKSALRFVSSIRSFAHRVLFLPDNGSYRSYARLDRRHVAWNVFAAPELSLTGVQSCFPFTGCLGYRGYFHENDARGHAFDLQARGLDVFVGGVTAYSTLGWFRDPVLDTMLYRDRTELAKLIFHELAHQKLYVADDTEFNEAFAEAVARIGLHKWLSNRPPSEYQAFVREQEAEDRFLSLVLEFKRRLAELYGSERDDGEKRKVKKALIIELRTRYAELKRRDDALRTYDNWFSEDINNARFVAVSTYRELVPGFLRLYASSGEELQRFYSLVSQLAACEPSRRHALLQAGEPGGGC